MKKAKVEILEKVLNKIDEKGAVNGLYIDSDGCMCAVGYIMAECGVDMNVFKDEDGLNGELAHVVAEKRSIAEPLEAFGFNGSELRTLQKINDNWDTTLDEPDRIEAIKGHIKEMIKEAK